VIDGPLSLTPVALPSVVVMFTPCCTHAERASEQLLVVLEMSGYGPKVLMTWRVTCSKGFAMNNHAKKFSKHGSS
jgi:hypothetical protein